MYPYRLDWFVVLDHGRDSVEDDFCYLVLLPLSDELRYGWKALMGTGYHML